MIAIYKKPSVERFFAEKWCRSISPQAGINIPINFIQHFSLIILFLQA
jgi:hypothetical protein